MDGRGGVSGGRSTLAVAAREGGRDFTLGEMEFSVYCR